MKNTIEIKNGSKFPTAVKNSALNRSKKVGKVGAKGVKRTVAGIAAEHGVGHSTLQQWRSDAGLTKPSKGQKALAAKRAKAKAYNTPVPCDAAGNPVEASLATHIRFHGKVVPA